MKLEYLQGKDALRNSGSSLNEGEAFVFVDGKQVKQEIIDRFDILGAYVGERATGITAKMIVNLYKVSLELIKFNEHVPCLKMMDIDDKDSWIEFALIPSQVHQYDGSIREDWYVSERLNDFMYTRPSDKYKASIQRTNKKFFNDIMNEEQSN